MAVFTDDPNAVLSHFTKSALSPGRGLIWLLIAAFATGTPTRLFAHTAKGKSRQVTSDDSTPATSEAAAPTENELRYANLSVALSNVAENSSSQRMIMGTVFLGMTGLFSGALIAENALLTGEPQTLARGVLGFSAGVTLLGAGYFFLVPSSYETEAYYFLRHPGRQSLAIRIEQGESLLRGLANRSRVARTTVGVALVALGAADFAWHIAEGSTPATAFLVYKGFLLGTFGLGLTIFKWAPELEYDAYEAEKTLPPSVSNTSKVTSTWMAGGQGGSLVSWVLRF